MFISISMSGFGNIARISFSLGRMVALFDKLDAALTKIQMLYSLMNAVNHFNGPVWRGAYQGAKGDSEFVNAISNFDTAIASIASNSIKIFDGVSKSGKVKEFIDGRNNSLLIYGPTPDEKTPWLKSSQIKIGKISLSKSHRDVKLELGKAKKQGGRMLGVGHTFGKSKDHKQWFRQDWHPSHGAHDERLVDPPYHYHW